MNINDKPKNAITQNFSGLMYDAETASSVDKATNIAISNKNLPANERCCCCVILLL